ncbi:putative quinol monooxygenase [Dysgonomonas sp. ZJ279]|uniref:putative quinol monooxygenase n=1 Tax=Dysgonomonas sp. ZJ279 TaxID=2709796 RepID=UPI0013ECD559|nr:antibiotic biosynthesis monooxygenase [Dysgonomonas sp. ZJ279]
MKSQKVESTVILRCKKGKTAEFKNAVIKLVKETEKELGCELFRIFENKDNSEEFVLWEIFKNEEALEAHMQAAHTKECFALGLFEPISFIHHIEVK